MTVPDGREEYSSLPSARVVAMGFSDVCSNAGSGLTSLSRAIDLA